MLFWKRLKLRRIAGLFVSCRHRRNKNPSSKRGMTGALTNIESI